MSTRSSITTPTQISAKPVSPITLQSASIAHAGRGKQELLDIGGRQLDAAAIEHVLAPAGDAQHAIVGEAPDVAGIVP